VTAFQHFLSGEFEQSFNVFFNIAKDYPTDLFAVKRGQLLAFLYKYNKGMLEILEPALKADNIASNALVKYLPAMHAFALQELDDFEQAEVIARKGHESFPNDPWCHHTLAHILYFQGRYEEGLKWMDANQESWSECMSFMYTHNYFHWLLFHLACRNFKSAVTMFDRNVWANPMQPNQQYAPEAKEPSFPFMDKCYSEDQMGALGCLLKIVLHLLHTSVSTDDASLGDEAVESSQVNAFANSRWQAILKHIKLPTPHISGLYDILVVAGLCFTDRQDDAAAMISSLSKKANTLGACGDADDAKASIPSVALQCATLTHSMCCAIVSKFAGDAKSAAETFDKCMSSQLFDRAVGGSHEQQEVIHELYVWLLVSAERQQDADAWAKSHKLVYSAAP
jgi:tetratricopeptide (TPR) repeat protein